MSWFRFVVLTLIPTTALAAQGAPSAMRREPLPLRQTLSFDLNAALDARWRLSVEPLVIGRLTVGLSASSTAVVDQPAPERSYALLSARETDLSLAPCAYGGPCYPYPTSEPTYRASSLSLHTRWYPTGLSRDGERQQFAVYIGEFLSYEERRISWPQWLEAPYPLPADSLGGSGLPWSPPSPGPSWVERLHGLEPGAEIGARLMMGQRVFIEVGGMVRIVTVDDPLSRRRPGDSDARLQLAIGFGW